MTVSNLLKESLRQVIDVLEHPDEVAPYTTLKNRLLSAHKPTTFQRIEMLHKMEPLGVRKLSELMSHMLEICLHGQERNEFFLFLFLQRLPRELRVLLGDDFADPGTLSPRPIACGPCTCMNMAQWRQYRQRSRYRFQLLPSREGASIAGPIGAGVQNSNIVAAEAVLLLGGKLPPPQRPTRRCRVPWPVSPRACATFNGRMATRPTDVRRRAAGETDSPGTPQRRRPWGPGLLA
jgi:hypothetical protein